MIGEYGRVFLWRFSWIVLGEWKDVYMYVNIMLFSVKLIEEENVVKF